MHKRSSQSVKAFAYMYIIVRQDHDSLENRIAEDSEIVATVKECYNIEKIKVNNPLLSILTHGFA